MAQVAASDRKRDRVHFGLVSLTWCATFGTLRPIFRVNVAERSGLVEAVRPLQPVKRQRRKKTISELQTEERFLLEDKERLMKMLEFEIIERDAIIAENRRLLSELASSQRAPAEAEPSKLKYFLPDLNAPLLEHLEPFCDETKPNPPYCSYGITG